MAPRKPKNETSATPKADRAAVEGKRRSEEAVQKKVANSEAELRQILAERERERRGN